MPYVVQHGKPYFFLLILNIYRDETQLTNTLFHTIHLLFLDQGHVIKS